MNLREEYLTNGYVIIKNFFSKEKLISLRDEFNNISNNFDQEIFNHEFVRNLYFSNKFFDLIKEILATNKLTYFSDASVVKHNDTFLASNGYHNDSRSEDYDYSKEYPLLRVATYFQESITKSGGVKVKPGSHKFFCLTIRDLKQKIKFLINKYYKEKKKIRFSLFLKGTQPSLELGDLIIWNLRTHHSGTSVKFKFNKNIYLHPVLEKIIPNFLKIPCLNRLSVFMVFGKEDLPDINFTNYVENRHRNQKYYYHNLNQLSQKLKEFNIKFIPSKKVDDS